MQSEFQQTANTLLVQVRLRRCAGHAVPTKLLSLSEVLLAQGTLHFIPNLPVGSPTNHPGCPMGAPELPRPSARAHAAQQQLAGKIT